MMCSSSCSKISRGVSASGEILDCMPVSAPTAIASEQGKQRCEAWHCTLAGAQSLGRCACVCGLACGPGSSTLTVMVGAACELAAASLKCLARTRFSGAAHSTRPNNLRRARQIGPNARSRFKTTTPTLLGAPRG